MSQIVIGKLSAPKKVLSLDMPEVGILYDVEYWKYRAMWQWLRYQYGRKIDAKIKKEVTEKYWQRGKLARKAAMYRFFNKHVAALTVDKQREMQYIMWHGTVVAVASLQHLLFPPEKVYRTANQILKKQGLKLQMEAGMLGKIAYVSETGGLKIGMQVYGGTITTRMAIRVASFVRVELCTNPISWLGVGGFLGWVKYPSGYFRALRIGDPKQLKPKLEIAINNSQKTFPDIQQKIENSKTVEMTYLQAKTIASAMSISYGLGARTIQQVIDQFEEEDQTQWGLAMALSWASKHGDLIEKGDNPVIRQKLSTISGATLLLDDIQKAEEKSYDWLKSHIVEGRVKTIDELLKDLNIH